MDDPSDNKRYICPKCGNIQDPLKVDEFNKIKHAERGQTIRSSSSSSGGNEEGRPFAEIIRSGTQDSKRSLLQNNNNFNDLEPAS